jgi:hypothetical protein
MKTNSESIHGTTASLFPKVSWDGRSTTHRNPDGRTRIYLHIFKRPEGGKLSIPGLTTRPGAASLLGTSTKLTISGKENDWSIELPEGTLNPIAAVVALDFRSAPTLQATPTGAK